MRGGVPPNIMIGYEKGNAIQQRAYKGLVYDSSHPYFGFFESNANYAYNATSTLFGVKGYFEKSTTCTPAAGANCIPGNILNWATMSALDLSRKALIGFGWPKLGGQPDAGVVFTYLGDLVSYGQWDDSSDSCVSGTHGGILYSFSLTKGSASPSQVEIRTGTSNCSGGTLIMATNKGANISVKHPNPSSLTDDANISLRIGLIQKIADKNRDLLYDEDAPRFGIKRWQASTASVDRQRDILCDSRGGNCTSTSKAPLVPELLNAISREPGVDGAIPLGTMMEDISKYFRGLSSTYEDKDNATTQSPYSWATDPLKACRKTFALYMTTGTDLTGALSTLPSACANLKYPSGAPYEGAGIAGASVTDVFPRNTCAAYNKDHYPADGPRPRQNISTFVAHTTFYGSGTSAVTKAKLQYAAYISDGLYYEVDKPEELLATLERAILEMLRRASSGTAASVLASGEGSGANLVQVVFYPETPRSPIGIFDTRLSWIGRLVNYWYFVDPLFKGSTILDDSGAGSSKVLDLSNDKKVTLRFSHEDDMTVADRYAYGSTSLIETIPFERTVNLWDAGVELWKRNIASDKRKIYTTINGTSFLPGNFSQDSNNGDTDNAATLLPYLNLTTAPADDLNSNGTVGVDDARILIRYVHGEDFHLDPLKYSLRPRTAAVDLNGDGDATDEGESAKVWKLGDILNSTPRIASWMKLNTYDEIYGDTTYKAFVGSNTYKNRGMVYAGGNDGMLHAFKLGTLELKWDGQGSNQHARVSGNNLGKEVWAFIPKNALPYLKYLTEIEYCHVYSVDLTPYIFDASINGEPSDTKTQNSWRTILIGGMRYGGACKNRSTTCSSSNTIDLNGDGTVNNSDCVRTPVNGNGYSSYFALDITDENNPQLLWEFSPTDSNGDSLLGYATTGPTIVRISARDSEGHPDKEKNGHWFAVIGSGPTGPTTRVPEYQFLGRSDQPLRLFIIPLRATPGLPTITVIDTGIENAFAGSMLNTNLDYDLDYQDDVVYVPYVKRGDGTWNQGGVLRLLTKGDPSPANWVWSHVVEDIGPVTSSVAKLLNKHKGILWLYFGTGRYYFEMGSATDDATSQRRLFGVKDTCFSSSGFATPCPSALGISASNCPVSGSVCNVTDINSVPSEDATASPSFTGWYINLDQPGNYQYKEGGETYTRSYRAERVITDPQSATTGIVFFTTYKPYNDICAYGGKSFIWALRYNTGGAPGDLLKGVALLQVSTGAIEQINLASAFTPEAGGEAGGRKTSALEGVPPVQQGLSLMTTPPPVKRVVHIKER